MPISRISAEQEIAAARLAFISAGQLPLSAPRRADTGQKLALAAADEPQPIASRLAQAQARSVNQPLVDHGAVSNQSLVDRGAVGNQSLEDRGRLGNQPLPEQPRPVAKLMALARLNRKHVLVMLVLLLCGVGVAVVTLGRSSASQVPLQLTSVSQSPSVMASSSQPPKKLRVHVMGQVAKPGVVWLAEGAIVLDAIQAAGGLTAEADPAELNLAAGLAEGQQVIVGSKQQPRGEVVSEPNTGNTTGQGASNPKGQLNLNTATQAELETLPGVGPVLAAAILSWRQENQKFSAVTELQEISGIGPKIYAKLAPLVKV